MYLHVFSPALHVFSPALFCHLPLSVNYVITSTSLEFITFPCCVVQLLFTGRLISLLLLKYLTLITSIFTTMFLFPRSYFDLPIIWLEILIKQIPEVRKCDEFFLAAQNTCLCLTAEGGSNNLSHTFKTFKTAHSFQTQNVSKEKSKDSHVIPFLCSGKYFLCL